MLHRRPHISVDIGVRNEKLDNIRILHMGSHESAPWIAPCMLSLVLNDENEWGLGRYVSLNVLLFYIVSV